MVKYDVNTQLGAIAQASRQGKPVVLRGNSTYLLCDALNTDSTTEVLRMKGKTHSPLLLCCASPPMVNRYVHNISHEAYITVKKLWHGPVFFVLPVKKTIPRLATCDAGAAIFAGSTAKFIQEISYVLNSPLMLTKVDAQSLVLENNDIVVEYNLHFYKSPVVFDGRDELQWLEPEALGYSTIP